MGDQERDVDVSRRDLGALLGVLGGAVGLAALSGCTDRGGSGTTPSEGAIGRVQQPWTTVDGGVTGTNFTWVDTVRGVGTTNPGKTLYTMSAGSDIDGGSGTGASSPVAIVGGYWTPGDGGGGVFYWSNASIVDDGGTRIVPVASGGDGGVGSRGPGWVRIYSGPLNVRWFGAKGDAATDDTVAIGKALQAASIIQPGTDAGGPADNYSASTVYLPSGTYMTSGLYLNSGTGSGTGNGAACFRLVGDGPAQVGATYGSLGGTVIRATGSSPVLKCAAFNFSIRDLTLDGNFLSSNVLDIAVESELGSVRDCIITRAANGSNLVYVDGTLQGDTILFERVTIQQDMAGGSTVAAACIYLNKNNACNLQCISCFFSGAADAIVLDTGAAISLLSCLFNLVSPQNNIKLIGGAQSMVVDGCFTEGSNGNFLYQSGPTTTYQNSSVILRGNTVSAGNTQCIQWSCTQTLILIGNYFGTNVAVTSVATNMPVVAIGNTFFSGGFTGTAASIVQQISNVAGAAPTSALQLQNSILGTAMLTVGNGLNSNVTRTTSYLKVQGPTAPFSLGGFTNWQDGAELTVFNTTSVQMTIVDEDTSSSVNNRIKTTTGGNVVIANSPGTARFIYDSFFGRWIMLR